MVDIELAFGARLRALRSNLGYSQEAFAHRCGLDRTYISGVERGKRNPTLRSLALIARGLDMTLSDLLQGI